MSQNTSNNIQKKTQQQNWQTMGRFGSSPCSSADNALREQLHQEIENKSKACANPTYKCNLSRVDGHEYCIKHILRDPRSPYNQCTYLYMNGRKCLNAVYKHDTVKGLTTFCFEHSRQAQLRRTRATVGKYRHKETNEVLLHDLVHHLKLSLPDNQNQSEDVIDVVTPPVTHFSVSEDINDTAEVVQLVRKKPRILDFASDSSGEDDKCALFKSYWQEPDDSDDESICSDEDDPLRHANVYTCEEAVRLSINKMTRLKELYNSQIAHLHHILKSRRRNYLQELRKEREQHCSIHDQAKNSASTREMYQKLKMLSSYHRRHGNEALLYRKFKEKRARIHNGSVQRPAFYTKCIYTEGGVRCSERIIPCSKYCRKHILEDKKQTLFRACKVEKSNVVCQEPTPCIGDDPNCLLHLVIPPKQQYTQRRNDSETEDEDETHNTNLNAATNVATIATRKAKHAASRATAATIKSFKRMRKSGTKLKLKAQARRIKATMTSIADAGNTRRQQRKPLRLNVSRRKSQQPQQRRQQQPVLEAVVESAKQQEQSATVKVEAIEQKQQLPVQQIVKTETEQQKLPTKVLQQQVQQQTNVFVQQQEQQKTAAPVKILQIPMQQQQQQQTQLVATGQLATVQPFEDMTAKKERQLRQQQQLQQQIKQQQQQQQSPQKIQILPRAMQTVQQAAQNQQQQQQVIQLPTQRRLQFQKMPIMAGVRPAIATVATTTAAAATITGAAAAVTTSVYHIIPGLPKSTSVTIKTTNALPTRSITATPKIITTMPATTGLLISSSSTSSSISNSNKTAVQIQGKIVPTTAIVGNILPMSQTLQQFKAQQQQKLIIVTQEPATTTTTTTAVAATTTVANATATTTTMVSKKLQQLQMNTNIQIQPKIIIAQPQQQLQLKQQQQQPQLMQQNLKNFKLIKIDKNQLQTTQLLAATAARSTPNLAMNRQNPPLPTSSGASFRLHNVTITPTWPKQYYNLISSSNNSTNNNNNNTNVNSSSSTIINKTTTTTTIATATTTATVTTTTTAETNSKTIIDAKQLLYLSKYNTVVRATKPSTTRTTAAEATTTTAIDALNTTTTNINNNTSTIATATSASGISRIQTKLPLYKTISSTLASLSAGKLTTTTTITETTSEQTSSVSNVTGLRKRSATTPATTTTAS